MKRIISFDVMRTIAVFAVVFEHIAGQNFFFSFPSFEWEVRNIYISLGRGFFSLFLMISGALFLSQCSERASTFLVFEDDDRSICYDSSVESSGCES